MKKITRLHLCSFTASVMAAIFSSVCAFECLWRVGKVVRCAEDAKSSLCDRTKSSRNTKQPNQVCEAQRQTVRAPRAQKVFLVRSPRCACARVYPTRTLSFLRCWLVLSWRRRKKKGSTNRQQTTTTRKRNSYEWFFLFFSLNFIFIHTIRDGSCLGVHYGSCLRFSDRLPCIFELLLWKRCATSSAYNSSRSRWPSCKFTVAVSFLARARPPPTHAWHLSCYLCAHCRLPVRFFAFLFPAFIAKWLGFFRDALCRVYYLPTTLLYSNVRVFCAVGGDVRRF